MRLAAALFALLALTLPAANAAAPGRVVTLTLPRAATANEEVVVRVRAGYLRRGMEIDVYDARGTLLGSVSPFAIRGHREAGTYSIPLHAVQARRIRLRLVLTDAGEPPRAPTTAEVRGVTTAFVPTTP